MAWVADHHPVALGLTDAREENPPSSRLNNCRTLHVQGLSKEQWEEENNLLGEHPVARTAQRDNAEATKNISRYLALWISSIRTTIGANYQTTRKEEESKEPSISSSFKEFRSGHVGLPEYLMLVTAISEEQSTAATEIMSGMVRDG